jgi:type VI secretion system protein ImpK
LNPEFSEAIDPLFERAIDLLKRIELQEKVSPEEEHRAILRLFDEAERSLGPTRAWYQASYAIAAWIDEMVLGSVWDGASWWSDRILEMSLFQSRECAHRFFELAQEAAAERDRNVTEVYFNCVLLGFRGKYRMVPAVLDMGADSRPPVAGSRVNRSHPPTIEAWIESMIPFVDIAGDARTVAGRERPMLEASPLMARDQFLWWSIAASVLMLLNVSMFCWFRRG